MKNILAMNNLIVFTLTNVPLECHFWLFSIVLVTIYSEIMSIHKPHCLLNSMHGVVNNERTF